MLGTSPGHKFDAWLGKASHARGEHVMSNTIAHRSHVHHVPLLPVFAVVATS